MDTTTAEKAQLMSEQSMVTLFGFTFNIYAVLLGFMILLVLYAIRHAQKDPASDFNWSDLFTSVDQTSGKRMASATKILQIIGGITGTFIVIKLTFQNNIGFEIFATYLAYVASIEGFSKFMIAKYGAGGNGGQYSNQNFGSGYNRGNYGYGGQPDYSQQVGYNGQPANNQNAQAAFTDPNDPDLPPPKPIDTD